MNAKIVLICDDEEGMRRYLKKMLEAAGLAVETFACGASLLRRIEGGSPGDAGLLLQDMMLPDTDGISILKRVRELRPALPVVLMTAYANGEAAAAARTGGACDFLSKPFTREAILEVIRSTVGPAG
ncbi:response regulator [Geobacter pickeringii]|uniref:Chemotaxis protein CheY n=1 Tax=Geobacter pickeringii TaxID=345632 RepID=A0A0B5B895_9BACT|nr:response regulator [Geobacter pickeringii]AJE02777.1 chemotaxis protein CheY [Geobacter pickeringii]